MSVYKSECSSSIIIIIIIIITDGNLTSPSRSPARGTSCFLINQTQAIPGRAALLSGLSCPGVGNYEDVSVVHFVMLSLTYEFWAIFQNFSQGGHSHLQGLGGCSRGARGGGDAYLLQTNQTPIPRSTHFMSHATFIAVLGVSVLKGLPVVILVRFFLAGRRIVNLFWSWPVLVL